MLRPAAADQLDLFDTGGLREDSEKLTVLLPVDQEFAAHRVGERYERRLELAGDRKRGGVYYTAPDIVARLLDLALEPVLDSCGEAVERIRALRVLDPAAGSGNFLSAAGHRIQRRLEDLGVIPSDAAAIAYGECLVGIDVDPTAVQLCAESLGHASRGVVTSGRLKERIVCGDALELVAAADSLFSSGWQSLIDAAQAQDGFDLVIGNPPFLSQLASETVRSEAYSARMRQRFGAGVAGLTDTAVLFLLLAMDAVKRDGGVVCLIQPISMLSARDATEARHSVLAQVGSSRVDLQACKLEYSIVSPK